MRSFLSRAFHCASSRPALSVAVLSGTAFAASMVGQYAVGLEPCPLCLTQRLIFGVLMVLSAVLSLLPRRAGATAMGLAFVTALGALGVATGLYHLALLLGLLGESCSILVPRTLGAIQETLPALLHPVLEGYGSCTPERGSLEYMQAMGLVWCALALFGTTMALSVKGIHDVLAGRWLETSRA